jgi:hypothetical protein
MTKPDLDGPFLFTSLIRVIQTHEGRNSGDSRRVYSVAALHVWLSYYTYVAVVLYRCCITNPDTFSPSHC